MAGGGIRDPSALQGVNPRQAFQGPAGPCQCAVIPYPPPVRRQNAALPRPFVRGQVGLPLGSSGLRQRIPRFHESSSRHVILSTVISIVYARSRVNKNVPDREQNGQGGRVFIKSSRTGTRFRLLTHPTWRRNEGNVASPPADWEGSSAVWENCTSCGVALPQYSPRPQAATPLSEGGCAMCQCCQCCQ